MVSRGGTDTTNVGMIFDKADSCTVKAYSFSIGMLLCYD